LTSANAANSGRPIHQLYPEHAKAHQRAGLSSSRLPTLRQVLNCRSGSQGRSRTRSATKSRAVFFCLGFSNFWKTRRQFMCYCGASVINTTYSGFEFRCLTAVSTIFESCFRGTLLRNVDSEDLRDRPCNCLGRSLVNPISTLVSHLYCVSSQARLATRSPYSDFLRRKGSPSQ
jgi:hypothetical protein